MKKKHPSRHQKMSVARGKNDGMALARRDQDPSWKWWKKRPESAGPGNGKSTFGAVLRPFKVVSTQNTRFMEDGFDLDVVYVTKRIIVHGVPNVSADPLYEDPRTEVRRLLDKYHCDRYKVYNFASELAQMTPPTHRMDTRVERYPFTDDTCPPLESVVDFCENAKAWLDAHEDNVVSLHCKAGKGRAGIMAACLMVRMGETAQAAVARYDTTQGAAIKRAGVNHRAWVFLYERLIREVWGLRETIGTVSGQNPGLKAPPRLATSIRDVSLQLKVPPRKRRWKQILHHPSCAVYQQTPAGKALVHRARMPSVSPRKRGQENSVFAAALPRSVVVEGTFQVVVSAATGLFGMAKNVLDVWCNTTFLEEDGGRELFTFTENDLPPGPLAKRLLAVNVSVVLTHTPPDAPSPDHRHIHAVDWEGMDSLGGVEPDATPTSGGLTLIGQVGHSVTPDTDPEEASDESMYENMVTGNHHTAGPPDVYNSPAKGLAQTSSDDEDDRHRFYFSSDDDESAKGTPARSHASLRLASGVGSLRILASPSKWSIQDPQGIFASGGGGGFTTPKSTNLPSPMRSCPRSAISSKRERLNERTDEREALARQQSAAAPPGLPRWTSSSCKAKAITNGSSQRIHDLPLAGDAAAGQHQHQQQQEESPAPWATTNGPRLLRASPAPAANGAAGGACASGDAASGSGGGVAKKPWAFVAPGSGPASGPAAARAVELDVAPGRDPPSSSGFRRPSPAVKLFLDAVSARSFEDPQSSRQTSGRGSEDGQVWSDASVSSDGEGDAEQEEAEQQGTTAATTSALVPSAAGGGPAVSSASPPHPRGAAAETRMVVAVGASGDVFDSMKSFESEGVESFQPLNQRRWPPPRGIVAGVEEVQGALESPGGAGEQRAHAVSHARRHGSTGSTSMSWGEDAKLALARKRLQWERSRRGASEGGSQSLRVHAALVAKREAELLAIETDVKQAVRILEERIAHRESAEAALRQWRRQLPPKAYNDVMSCLAGNQSFGLYGSG
ncbi:unnamed protein product [Ectocarpus sp. 13 AM-2016]